MKIRISGFGFFTAFLSDDKQTRFFKPMEEMNSFLVQLVHLQNNSMARVDNVSR